MRREDELVRRLVKLEDRLMGIETYLARIAGLMEEMLPLLRMGMEALSLLRMGMRYYRYYNTIVASMMEGGEEERSTG